MRFALAMLLAVCAAACGPHQAAVRKEALMNRASFDFECPKEKLELTPLDPDSGDASWAALNWRSVGVRGCDKKAVYVLQALPHGDGVWVLNTDGRKD